MDYSASSALKIPPASTEGSISCPAEKAAKESTFEEEKRTHFKAEDLANATIHDNAFLSCCLGPDRYGAAISTPFTIVILGPPYDGREASGGAHASSTLSYWFSSSANDSRPFLKSLWQVASYRVCCDGAYDMVLKSGGDALIKPDLLVGRLDELNDQTKAEIERDRNDKTKSATAGLTATEASPTGRKVTKEWNQVEMARENSDDWTDLQKALWKMKEQREKSTANPFLHQTVVCYYDGPIARLDKILSHINALYQFHTVFPRLLLLTDSSSLTELLAPGHHILLPNKELEGVYASCGIFPIGSVCRKIYATGLHWPLHGDMLSFGGLVSTCNAIVSDRILIENTDPVIFHTNLMTMSTPLQTVRSLVATEPKKVESSPSSSTASQSNVAAPASSSNLSAAPKSTSLGSDITGAGTRTQSLSGPSGPAKKVTDKSSMEEPTLGLHHDHGFAQHEPLVPDPSMTTAPAGSYGHGPAY